MHRVGRIGQVCNCVWRFRLLLPRAKFLHFLFLVRGDRFLEQLAGKIERAVLDLSTTASISRGCRCPNASVIIGCASKKFGVVIDIAQFFDEVVD
jgi:hypothetical protein